MPFSISHPIEFMECHVLFSVFPVIYFDKYMPVVHSIHRFIVEVFLNVSQH
jgi:hypothetical protein